MLLLHLASGNNQISEEEKIEEKKTDMDEKKRKKKKKKENPTEKRNRLKRTSKTRTKGPTDWRFPAEETNFESGLSIFSGHAKRAGPQKTLQALGKRTRIQYQCGFRFLATGFFFFLASADPAPCHAEMLALRVQFPFFLNFW